MTKVGKALVFFNLIFSLVVGGLVVFAYSVQVKWAKEHENLQQQFKVMKASNDAYVLEMQKVQDYLKTDEKLGKTAGFGPADDPAVKLRKVNDALTAAVNDAAAARGQLDKTAADLAAEKLKTSKSDALVTSAQSELKKRQDEAESTRALLKKQDGDIAKMLKQMTEMKDKQVSAELAAKAFQDRNTQLVNEKDTLARDNQRLVSSGANPNAGKVKDVNPPAENIEGLIREVGASGLVRITIGSDAGLAKNHTLEVFRLNEKAPDQSKYLGRIKIVEVGATEAVGQPMGKPAAPFQPGDQVGSRIGG